MVAKYSLITVVIPNYNNGNFLKDCINSVYTQSHKNIEVIVVDDGSKDNSLEVLKILKQQYDDLMIVSKENGGPSTARNAGLKLAKGEYISFLDSDDFWDSKKLEEQLDFLEQNGFDIVFSNYKNFQEGNFYEHNENILASYSDLSPFSFFEGNPLIGSASNILLKKGVYKEVGDWDSYLRAGEDTDYWFRCVLKGFSIGYLNKFHVMIRSHESNARSDFSRMFHYQFLAIEKWQDLLKEKGYDISSVAYKRAIRAKLSKLRWYCKQMDRPDLALSTFLIGTRYFKLNYFNRLTILQFFKTSVAYFKFLI